ncbi:MAG TPA: cytochrome c peroxidase [Vicinamibacterales bacterium]|jgi:cytochrome c peroxidase|nr:cytochrome c peroxidase [Vicinamibacterales bacterium]
MKSAYLLTALAALLTGAVVNVSGQGTSGTAIGTAVSEGKKLFEQETFSGNGRTCRTCHSVQTGTVSPEDAQQRFKTHPDDPLFRADGSDDGAGNGTTRIQRDATIMMHITLNARVQMGDHSAIMNVPRGIPTTLNSPALDPVIMLDGRQLTLQSQANGAILDHAQGVAPSAAQLDRIKAFELTNEFFTSPEMINLARAGTDPGLPPGSTASEKRGRRFFEDEIDFVDPKHGLCAGCHAGPLLNETNLFAQIVFGVPKGTRFQNIGVSFFNDAKLPLQEFVFDKNTANELHVFSPDIGRSGVTGVPPTEDFTFANFEAFKIPQLRGVKDTAPYFHDNSAKTLEDVMNHYARFFFPFIVLTDQDKADMVAYMKLLR